MNTGGEPCGRCLVEQQPADKEKNAFDFESEAFQFVRYNFGTIQEEKLDGGS